MTIQDAPDHLESIEREHPVANPDLRHLEHVHDGESRIYIHPERPVWVAVNPFGERVISLCDGRRSIQEIAGEIEREVEAGTGEILADVETFLDQVARIGLSPTSTSTSHDAEPPALKGLFLHLTGRCNLRCAHCYIEASPEGRVDMPLPLVLRLIDEAADLGSDGITLSGGEPLMREEIETIVRHASGKVGEVQLLTNGTLIDSRVAGFLTEQGVRVQVSLDSAEPGDHDALRGEGAWDRAVRGIEALRAAGIGDALNLCLTLTKRNIAGAPAVFDFAASMGIPLVRLVPLERTGRGGSNWESLAPTREQLEGLYRAIYSEPPTDRRGPKVSGGLSGLVIQVPDPGAHDAWCPVGRILAVDANGDAYPCAVLIHPPFRLGNVNEEPLERILAGDALTGITRDCRARRSTVPECRSCPWKSLCQGGCTGVAYTWTGALGATDGLCRTRDALYREILFGVARKKRPLPPAVVDGPC